MAKYRDTTITRTEAVCLNNGRRLYALEGAVRKAATVRPLLTTQQDARDYVDAQILTGAEG